MNRLPVAAPHPRHAAYRMFSVRWCVPTCLVIVVLAVIGTAPAEASYFRACRASGQAAPFMHYWLGSSFEDLRLIGRTYSCSRPDFQELPLVIRTNMASFLYGECDTAGDAGCDSSLEVQTWPACDRNFSSYDFGSLFRRPTLERRLGVPSAVFGDDRIELYTGDVTVIIFASSVAQGERAVRSLRATSGAENPGARLLAPVAGSLDGLLDCGLPRPHTEGVHVQRCQRSRVDYCRRVVLRVNVRRAGVLSGEVARRGRSGASDVARFATRVRGGRSLVRFELSSAGLYRGRYSVTAADGRRSRPLAFRVRAR